jgi:excisionase family DNA binding protein
MTQSVKNPADTYISTRIAAQMLDVSLRTIQLWVESGVLKAWKTAGGHRKVSRQSVEEVLKKRQEALQSEHYKTAPPPFQILLVEDDEGIRQMFKYFFMDWKHPVEFDTADDGFDGLVKLATYKPDLLIADITMPGVNGYDMLKFLEKSPQFKSLDIIIITGLPADKVAEYGPLPKKAALFFKPLSFDELDAHISAIITRKKQEKQVATGND